MRTELRAIQQRVGLTFIYITHDQGEALTMSDQVAVMNAGVIEQVGDPQSIYNRPRTPFVASFVGESNTIPGGVLRQDGGFVTLDTPLGPLTGQAAGGREYRQGDACLLFVRPEQLSIEPGTGANAIAARRVNEEFEGSIRTLYLSAQGIDLRLYRMNTPGTGPALPEDETLTVSFQPEQATVLPLESSRSG